MSQPANQEPYWHFLVYLVAGAAMGGFLDVAVFGEGTPLYGSVGGVVIATFYQLALWIGHRWRRK